MTNDLPRPLATAGDEDDEPVAVAFHDSPDEEQRRTPSPPPPPAADQDSITVVTLGLVPHSSDYSLGITPIPVTLTSPLPTIKPVTIVAKSAVQHAQPPPSPVFHDDSGSTVLHSDNDSLKELTSSTQPSAPAPQSPYVFTPTPTMNARRVSAYAISLLSSGSIFRSYKLNAVNNQVEFQDIKLYAIFPPALVAASAGASAGSSPRLIPAAAAAATETTLYWGPPHAKTSQPSSNAMRLSAITDIFKGKKSLLFHSPSPLVALLSNSRCFSIASPSASLHLEALTEQIREEWIARIVEILRVTGGRRLEFSHADEGEEDETRREKERRERLRHIQQIQAQQYEAHLHQQKAAAASATAAGGDAQPELSTSSNLSVSLTPSASESTLSLSQSSFLFRNMRVVTKERTAREKLESHNTATHTTQRWTHTAQDTALTRCVV